MATTIINTALVLGLVLVLACVLAWVTGIDPFGLAFREILTLVAPVILLAALIASYITLRKPTKLTRLLRLAGWLLLASLVLVVLMMARLMSDIGETMQYF